MEFKTDNRNDIRRNLEISSSSGKWITKKKFLIALIFMFLVIMIIMLSGGKGNDNTATYKTKEVTRGPLTVTVTATGSLEPTNMVEVGSELSGIVKTVEADYNDHVDVGQVLARLDTSKIEAQVKQSKASLESAQARVLEAHATLQENRDQLDRLKHVWEISGNKVPSKNELDSAEAALQRAIASETSAKAQVLQAKATLEAQETDKSKMVIRSPIKGIVLTRNVEPGQTVAASFQAPVLFTLAEDLTKMELNVDVDEADVGMVQDNQEALFTVDAYPDRSFNARIRQVRFGAKTLEGVVTYETILDVENKDMLLRPGMTATAEIIVKKIENAILIPNAALRYKPPITNQEASSGSSRGFFNRLVPRPPRSRTSIPDQGNNNKEHQQVWTIHKGQLQSIPISTGLTDGVMTEIIKGDLKPGMALIVD